MGKIGTAEKKHDGDEPSLSFSLISAINPSTVITHLANCIRKKPVLYYFAELFHFISFTLTALFVSLSASAGW
ncbi:hypothetical protein K445DRAFT_228305 [Daldinia sp. EC12]|nr:hypothetical protein K445DRAFT_228305 [Daldinia sp. EC12]